MRFGFAYNPTIGRAVELRARAAAWCDRVCVEHWEAAAGDCDGLLARLPDTDALIVMGGDGTFLRAARAVAEVDVPLLGINLGKTGFLSKAEEPQLETVLEQVRSGDYAIEERMALEARIVRAHPAGESGSAWYVALNDAAIVRGSPARVIRLEVTIDGSHLATYTADGIVVATPTGSTAYSFSAGGPIVDPAGRNLVVTTVAAYLSAVRSVVVDPRRTIRVEVLAAAGALVSIDGHTEWPLEVGDTVEIRARVRPIRFIEPVGATAFWDLVRRKAQLLPS
jgi:NAD+ kinase